MGLRRHRLSLQQRLLGRQPRHPSWRSASSPSISSSSASSSSMAASLAASMAASCQFLASSTARVSSGTSAPPGWSSRARAEAKKAAQTRAKRIFDMCVWLIVAMVWCSEGEARGIYGGGGGDDRRVLPLLGHRTNDPVNSWPLKPTHVWHSIRQRDIKPFSCANRREWTLSGRGIENKAKTSLPRKVPGFSAHALHGSVCAVADGSSRVGDAGMGMWLCMSLTCPLKEKERRLPSIENTVYTEARIEQTR